jgi:F-box/TPR repeat protein Pof3
MIPGIGFSEERILAILRQFPNLGSVDLSRTTVTGVVLRELVDRESSPTDIVINQCSKMSPDAVEWARKKGVNIQYIMLKASMKRARYL